MAYGHNPLDKLSRPSYLRFALVTSGAASFSWCRRPERGDTVHPYTCDIHHSQPV